jgi:hypothetical protein
MVGMMRCPESTPGTSQRDVPTLLRFVLGCVQTDFRMEQHLYSMRRKLVNTILSISSEKVLARKFAAAAT